MSLAQYLLETYCDMDEIHPQRLLDAERSRNANLSTLKQAADNETTHNRRQSNPNDGHFHCQGTAQQSYQTAKNKTNMQKQRIKQSIYDRTTAWRTPRPDMPPERNADRLRYINKWLQDYSASLKSQGTHSSSDQTP